MSAPSTCMLHLRERIRSLQSAGIEKIWMKVSGNGDFTMANVLGFLDSDLVLLLKTIGLITSSKKINYPDTWCTRMVHWNS